MDKDAFCYAVDDIVEIMYGETDGGDLCYNLLEQGVVTLDMSPDQAARIVAQHIQQA